MPKLNCLIPGRFQPFHRGHKELIQSAIDDGLNPIVLMRLTPKSETDPYSYEERYNMIKKEFPDIEIMPVPDFRQIRYGRSVGYEIYKMKLPEEVEQISATKIRNKEITNELEKM